MEFTKRNLNMILRITLIVLYIMFIVFSWGKWGHVISDCFREAIIPEAMLDGNVLYRDILNLYPPFAYQINALLFKIFGCNLNVLYAVGIACGATILTFLYKLVKEYSSEITAFVATLTVMELFTFRICVKNSASWIFPYSYSFLYAFTFCFVGICVYLLKKKNPENDHFKTMMAVSLLIGFSIASKWDFLLLGLIPIFESVKNKSIKEVITYLGLMIVPSLLSFGVYLLFGGSVLDLSNQVQFLINFSHAPSVQIFNETIMPQRITLGILRDLGMSFGIFIKQFATIGLFAAIMFVLLEKFSGNKILQIFISAIFVIIGWFFIIQPFSVTQFTKFGINTNIVFVPYVLAIWAIAVVLLKFIKHREFSDKEKFCLSLVVIGFLFTFRQFAEVLNCYIGNFTILPYWIAFIYLFVEIMPSYIKKLQLPISKKSLFASLIVFCLTFTYIFIGVYCPKMNCKISNDRGIFYVGLTFSKPLNEAIDDINFLIPTTEKSLLVIDDGLVLNWFSSRKTDLKFYSLIPHMVDTIGEDNVVAELSQKLPDYIFLTNNDYPGVGVFGEDYAINIKNLILKNYELVKKIEADKVPDNEDCIFTIREPIFLPEMNNPLSISIYKKK